MISLWKMVCLPRRSVSTYDKEAVDITEIQSVPKKCNLCQAPLFGELFCYNIHGVVYPFGIYKKIAVRGGAANWRKRNIRKMAIS